MPYTPHKNTSPVPVVFFPPPSSLFILENVEVLEPVNFGTSTLL